MPDSPETLYETITGKLPKAPESSVAPTIFSPAPGIPVRRIRITKTSSFLPGPNPPRRTECRPSGVPGRNRKCGEVRGGCFRAKNLLVVVVHYGIDIEENLASVPPAIGDESEYLRVGISFDIQ